MTTSAARPEAGPLRCMELIGGAEAVERSLTLPGLDAWIFSRPFEGARSGGDVHYVSLCGGGKIVRLIVADVSGHGATVAAFAAGLRDLMRRHITRADQTALVRAINRGFGAEAGLGRFATAVVLTYLAHARSLTTCNAAHPRPLWYRAADSAWSTLDPEAAAGANLPLGVDDDAPYEQFTIPLGLGDLVVLYTDVLTEAADASGRMLGEPGLLAIARTLDPSDPRRFGPSLLEAVDRHRGNRPPDDDATLVVLRHDGTGPRPPGPARMAVVVAKMLGLARI